MGASPQLLFLNPMTPKFCLHIPSQSLVPLSSLPGSELSVSIYHCFTVFLFYIKMSVETVAQDSPKQFYLHNQDSASLQPVAKLKIGRIFAFPGGIRFG